MWETSTATPEASRLDDDLELALTLHGDPVDLL